MKVLWVDQPKALVNGLKRTEISIFYLVFGLHSSSSSADPFLQITFFEKQSSTVCTSNPLLGWGLPPPLQPAWIAHEGWLLGTWSSPFYEIGLGAIVTVWIFSHLVPLASSYTQFCTPRRPARIARIPSTRDEAGLAFKGSFIQPSFIIDRLSPAFRFSSSVPPGLGGLSSTVSAYDLSVFLLNLPLGLEGFSSIGL